MPTPIFRIIYCSRNAIDSEDRDQSIAQILDISRRNNARDGVTGALLYNDGMFVQTLEGDFDAVQTVFERIQGDERHQDVVVLQAVNVAAPIFADWAMAFAEPDDNQAAQAILSHAIADPDDRACNRVLTLLNRVVRHEPELAT